MTVRVAYEVECKRAGWREFGLLVALLVVPTIYIPRGISMVADGAMSSALLVAVATIMLGLVVLCAYVLTEVKRLVVSGGASLVAGRLGTPGRRCASNATSTVRNGRYSISAAQARADRRFVDADRDRVVSAFAGAGAELGVRTDEDVPAETRDAPVLYQARRPPRTQKPPGPPRADLKDRYRVSYDGDAGNRLRGRAQ